MADKPKLKAKVRPKVKAKPVTPEGVNFDMVDLTDAEVADAAPAAADELDIMAESGGGSGSASVMDAFGPSRSSGSADLDVELLTSMVAHKDNLLTVHHAGLHPLLIGDPNLRQPFKEMLTFYQKRGFPMTRDIFIDHNPDIGLFEQARPIKEVLYDIEIASKMRSVVEAEREIQSLMDPDLGGNPYRPENLDKIFEVYRDSLRNYNKMFAMSTDRIQTFGDGKDIIEAYNARTKGIISGIPICFPVIAEDIPAWDFGHVTGLIARPGERKTFLMLYLICKAVIDTEYKGFIHSSEMTTLELKQRMTTMLAGLNYTDFTRGKLNKEGQTKLITFLKSDDVKKLDENLHIAGPTAVQDVASIEIECAERGIKFIGLDNAVTLEAEGEAHIKVQNMMFEMKYMAIRLGAHVIFTSHQNRSGGRGMQGVAYGDAINTWSSNLFNMHMTRGEVIELQSFKVRSGRGNMMYRIQLDLTTGIVKEIGRLNMQDSAKSSRRAAEATQI